MIHTPGPWEADSTAVLTSSSPYRTIADCSQRGHTLEVEEANARLIAAAPDMLEAAYLVQRGLNCWCEHGIGNPMVSTHSIGCQAMRDAIAKAVRL